ncbi:MAG: hypothetical protein O3A51_09740, partial [Verrucomicrobia bacterium]|nr:hypothetical protein [Verrucomicrobiota bacterium]
MAKHEPPEVRSRQPLPVARRSVLIGAGLLFGLWSLLHLGDLTGEQNGSIRFMMTLIFGILILVRPKASQTGTREFPDLRASLMAAVPGLLLLAAGLLLTVRQLEWLGLLLLLWSCLRWSLPRAYTRDLTLCLGLVYFAHPLPAQIFGPLQLVMQKLSVIGAERLLIALNVRAWSLDMVLYNGFA